MRSGRTTAAAVLPVVAGSAVLLLAPLGAASTSTTPVETYLTAVGAGALVASCVVGIGVAVRRRTRRGTTR